MLHYRPYLSPCFFMMLFFLFCFGTSRAALAAETPLPVIVSIAPQKYMLERIAGDRVAVTALVKPGADPHSYEPSPAQMRSCASARAWFTIGVPFEDVWLPRIRNTAHGLQVVSTIATIHRLHVEESGHEEHDHHDGCGGGDDPHVWLSPMLVREMLPGMAKELGRLMPEHAGEFRTNARKFAAELEELDGKLAEDFSTFPREQRVFLTFHPSWRYFAHNYGLTELTIEVDGKEPGPKSMKAVIDAAKAHGIRTIFVEPQFSKAAARAIAANIGAVVVEADPLAEDLPATYKNMAAKLVESFKR